MTSWPTGVLALLTLPLLLAGCLDSGSEPSAPGLGAPAPGLPDGLELADATVLTANTTLFQAVWTSTTPNQPVTDADLVPRPQQPATTTLTLPPNVDYAIEMTLTWPSGDDLDLFARDGADVVCSADGADNPEHCSIRWVPAHAEERTWILEVVAYPAPYSEPNVLGNGVPAGADVPFELLVEVRPTGPHGVPWVPGGAGDGP